jgi:hypothetical protein
MPVISVLGRLKQEDLQFEASLCYLESSRPAGLHRKNLSQKKLFYDCNGDISEGKVSEYVTPSSVVCRSTVYPSC